MMKLFNERELREAYAHAAKGGQALHMHSPGPYRNVPKCFKKSREWAHLFDNDIDRLKKTARRLGVRVIKVSYTGKPGQHIDLCGKPLEKAVKECEGSLNTEHTEDTEK